ncbi:Kelch repeat-containing protein [Maribacter hydrothermalis]|nr:kelch repeat-containing protein [Maribacter hydrothermalis]
MKTLKLILVVAIVILTSSCQKEEIYNEPSNNHVAAGRTFLHPNIDLDFDLETTNSEMGGFASHSITQFNDQLWLVGGDNNNTAPWTLHSEVWKSKNGKNWKLVTSNQFDNRKNHSLLVFKDKMWLIGGINNAGEILSDIWNTTDGIHWNNVKSLNPLTDIGQNNSIVFNNRIYVFIGNNRQQQEVWSSSNGINWRMETNNAFPVRNHYKTIVYKNTLYIIGGWIRGGEFTNEVWASTDGIHWHENSPASTVFENRINHTATVFEGKVWVIGGQSSNKLGARTFYGDVWYSNDMKYWYKYDKKQPLLKGLHSHESLLFNNKLWIFGGYRPDSSMSDILEDNIWSIE